MPEETGLVLTYMDSDAPSAVTVELANSCGGKLIKIGPSCTPVLHVQDEVTMDIHDDHQPERMPDELTNTVIGKMMPKRKNTADKEESSEPKSKLVKMKSANDLYSCKIDNMSETQIVDAIQSINYSIGNFVANILDVVKKAKLSPPNPPSKKLKHIKVPNPDITLRSLLLDFRQSAPKRDLVVEALFHDLICCLLHKHFFKGGHFFGVGSEEFHGYLETMYSKLAASGNSDPIAIQRWRSMNVEAVFQMNGAVESQLNDELITELGLMLKIAFPLLSLGRGRQRANSESQCESIVHGEQQSLMDIIQQARQLSYIIQHEIISCQLLVTIAPVHMTSDIASDERISHLKYKQFDTSLVSSAWADMCSKDGDQVLGTHAFGLTKISGPELSDILILPKVSTSAMYLNRG